MHSMNIARLSVEMIYSSANRRRRIHMKFLEKLREAHNIVEKLKVDVPISSHLTLTRLHRRNRYHST